MKKTKRFISALLTCAMCLAMASCGGNSTPNNPGSATGDKSNAPATGDNTVYTLSWAHSSSTNDRLALATEKMAEELKEASNGRLDRKSVV